MNQQDKPSVLAEGIGDKVHYVETPIVWKLAYKPRLSFWKRVVARLIYLRWLLAKISNPHEGQFWCPQPLSLWFIEWLDEKKERDLK